MIFSKKYTEPPFGEKEILRYAGCKDTNNETLDLARDCINEIKTKLTYRVCYRPFNANICGDVCDFDAFTFRSKTLATHLQRCNRVVVFAATIGVEIDRLITKYGRISPSKALLFQAIGAERIEALCDVFCADIAEEYHTCTKPRFSPGYGDLPLECQKDLFSVLSPEKQIGLFLTGSLLMSPSKSVTAIVGLSEKEEIADHNNCTACNQTDCSFRGAL